MWSHPESDCAGESSRYYHSYIVTQERTKELSLNICSFLRCYTAHQREPGYRKLLESSNPSFLFRICYRYAELFSKNCLKVLESYSDSHYTWMCELLDNICIENQCATRFSHCCVAHAVHFSVNIILNYCVVLTHLLPDRCLPPPYVNHAVAVMNQTGRTVDVTCLPGYRFPDGVIFKQFTCHLDGSWNYRWSRCDGEMSILLHAIVPIVRGFSV